MSFMIEDDNVLVKCNAIQSKIKEIKDIMLHINPVYDEKYIKVKEFNGLVNTRFLGNQVPKKVWIMSHKY